ncbi:hypothetical protein [Georgenia sp. SUBG003]|uniref:hypothetical protein n=1 Tax=Georgenia sp. SUBG003 TaxID=1497974 RepID=UPI003AB7601C
MAYRDTHCLSAHPAAEGPSASVRPRSACRGSPAATRTARGRSRSGCGPRRASHQSADILFCKANLVPVGKDQLPHLEQARVIARRFDERYGRAGGRLGAGLPPDPRRCCRAPPACSARTGRR